MPAHRVERIQGRGLAMRGDDIDTDRIIPARFLRSITFEGMERHVFEDERAGSAAASRTGGVHPFDAPQFQGAGILIVNRNFGCGSSREHAPQALHRWGIQAVVGESFSEIFFGNAAMIGLPCVTASPEDVRALMDRIEAVPTTLLTLDLRERRLDAGDRSFAVLLPAHARDAFVTGAWDTTGLLLERYDEVDATSARLPYVTGF
jgi:3-isopropylmalate/(R)-2-methylmalate dehydratase small subunit